MRQFFLDLIARFRIEDQKVLVIHPADPTTDMLKVIYQDKKNWTVITDPLTPNSEIVRAIHDHDKIILLGHGSPSGLVAFTGDVEKKNCHRFIVESKHVYLLRERELVGIWCHADQFFNRYKLKGLFTGMIISEYDEALENGIDDFKLHQITESNDLFAGVMRMIIRKKNDLSYVERYKAEGNPIVEFNRTQIYLKE